MKNKKLIAILTLLCFMFTLMPVAAMAADTQDTVILKIGSTDVYKNGVKSTIDVAPTIVDGRTLVPVRVIMEALGGDVDWDETTRTVTININGKVLKLVIDKEIPGFGTGAMIIDSRTMVPIRYISEYAGAEVQWFESTQQIFVKSAAKEVKATYTVSFDLNTGSEGVYKTVTVEEGKTVEKPAVEYKSGRVFHGWYTNDEGKGDAYDFSTPIYSDLTLYGHWSSVSYGGGHSHTYSDKYTSNGDGTHSKKCSCGSKIETADCDFNADLICTACGADLNEIKDGNVVAKSEGALAKALANGNNVTLANDIEVTEMIEIPANISVVLDLNGNDITTTQNTETGRSPYALSNYGELIIKDSATGGKISARGIYNQDGATLTVNGAEIVAQDWNGGACIWSYGTGEVYLKDAILTGYTGVVSSEGYVEINGGTYTCYSGIKDDGTQATAPTYNIRAYNGLKITDGTFTSRHGVISVGGGEAVIEGGSYTIEFTSRTTSNVVYVYGNSDLTINGGDFTSDNTSGKADSGAAVLVSDSNAKVKINDGTYVGMNGMVSGNVNTAITGGTFNTVWDYNHYGKLEPYVADGYEIIKMEDGANWVVPENGEVTVDSESELQKALSNGNDVVLTENIEMEAATTAPYGNKYALKQDGGIIDGNGNELYMECYGDDYGIMTSGGTVKNITITEACRAIMIMYPTEDIILDNVNIGGDGVLYPINTGEAGSEGVNLIVTNSTIKGWTSYSNIESASFTNVKFEQGTYYNNIYGRVLKPYVNTTLTDCSFIEHMNLDLSCLANGHKVTISNCTVNGQNVTADVFTIPSTDAEYDTELFTVDLPSWATSIEDCVVFK